MERMRSFVVVTLIVGMLVFALPESSFARWPDRSGNLPGIEGGKTAIIGVLIAGGAAAAYYFFFRKKAPEVGIALNPEQLEFGNVAVMESAKQILSVFNTSTQPVELLSISVKGDHFAISDVPALPLTLGPGEKTLMTLAFSPARNGKAKGEIHVHASRAGRDEDRVLKVRLKGEAIAASAAEMNRSSGSVSVSRLLEPIK